MRALYIIKTGSTFPSIAQQHGDFENWIIASLLPTSSVSTTQLPITVIDAQSKGIGLPLYPTIESCAGVVISGSHAMVTEQEPWMQHLQQWLLKVCCSDIPVLGICFGHQILAHTLGGEVYQHPAGLEIGTVPIAVHADVTSDPLWKHLPRCFDVQTVHYQSVKKLPPGACAIAGNAHDAHHAFRWRNNVWGVQFHPEFSAAVMQDYLDHVDQGIKTQNISTDISLARRCTHTPEAAKLLYYFGLHVRQVRPPSFAVP